MIYITLGDNWLDTEGRERLYHRPLRDQCSSSPSGGDAGSDVTGSPLSDLERYPVPHYTDRSESEP